MKYKNNAFSTGCDEPERLLSAPFVSALLIAILASSVLAQPSTAPIISNATVLADQTALTLPPGDALYIFGMAAGGALSSKSLARGQVQQAVNAAGRLTGALAITPSNSNSFTTDTFSHTIGGVRVSNFKAVNASYGLNNQPHASSVSDTFIVSDPALVVVVAIAGGQNRLDLQGIPGLQIDAKTPESDRTIAMAIAHTNLARGTYTVTETSGGRPDLDPNCEADLIGVFVFTASPDREAITAQGASAAPPGSPPAPSQQSAPRKNTDVPSPSSRTSSKPAAPSQSGFIVPGASLTYLVSLESVDQALFGKLQSAPISIIYTITRVDSRARAFDVNR
jgi:hypothetical protein